MTRTKIRRSSGNVYAHLRFPNPAEHAIKAELVLLESHQGTKAHARCGGQAPWNWSTGRFEDARRPFRQFSVERLMRYLVALGMT